MKKQILFLFFALFILGTSQLFAQTITPRPITGLTHNALNPIPGQEYTYRIDVPTPDGTKSHKWFVTTNLDFLEARDATGDGGTFREKIGGTYIASGDIAAADGFYLNTDTPSELAITWKSIALAADEYLFVVIYTENTDVAGCISDNLKVYRIEPQSAFTLDIANMGEGPNYGTNINVCPDDVTSAVFNPAGAGQVVFAYGENTLIYEIVAANFVGSYQLLVQFGGQHAAQDVVLEWSRTSDFSGVTTPIALTGGAGDVIIEAAGGSEAAVGETGEVIYIRAVITHNNYEGLANRPFTLAINGFTNGMEEVYHVDGTNDGFDNDFAIQTITARPDIRAVAPTPFVPDNSAN